MTLVRKTNHQVSFKSISDVPSGYEVFFIDGRSFRSKLRKKLHGPQPLGVTIHHRLHGKTEKVEQFDITPNLDGTTRALVSDMLVECFKYLGSETTFERGIAKLEKLLDTGLCVRCIFKLSEG